MRCACCSASRRSRWASCLPARRARSRRPEDRRRRGSGGLASPETRHSRRRIARRGAKRANRRADADLYPAISITGTFGGIANNVQGHNLLQVFHPIGRTFSVGPSFQWNLLNYGQITNNVRLQDATLQEYLVDYQNAVLKAQQEVENGISSFLLSRAQADYLHRSVVAANGALGIATLEYQQGTRDFTTVLTAEQNLYQAENNLAMATGNISTGLVAVFRALGGGWQIRDGNGFVNPSTAEEMRRRTNWGSLLPPPGGQRRRQLQACPDPRTAARQFARRNGEAYTERKRAVCYAV